MLKKKNLRAYLSLAIVLLVTFGMFLAFAFTGSANDEAAQAEKPEINVWLIGGQSNAVGYATDVSEYQAQDNRYFEGFDNVLYYGYSEKFVPGIEEVQFGQGQGLNKAGAEIGIANALADSGTTNIVIKYAQGASYLYPNTTANVSQNYGTWTSPTYIKNHNVDTAGTKTGLLYTKFIETVTSTCAQLEEMGYTPVVRGMWWMQGEAECGNETEASAYAELLETLITDVRRDVGKITGQDLSNMPFAFGKIYRNPANSMPQYLSVVTDCQAEVAAKEGFNAILVDPTKCEGLGQHDSWHFNAATQSYFGEMLVAETLKLLGLSMVDVEGTNVTLSGGGFYKAGDSVTVTLTAPEGYTITGVTMSVDGGASTPITLTNGKYTFTSEGKNVVFKATTEGSEEVTPYGNIPSEFDADNYPFALFTDSFVGAYTYYGAAMDAAKGILYGSNGAGKSATVYMRRDYASGKKDATSEVVTHLNGVLNIDLGGNTFTRTSKGYFLDTFAKATDGALFTSTVNTKNGTLLGTGSTMIGLNHAAESLLNGSLKTIAIGFENVTFAVSEGAKYSSGIGVITSCWENGANGANFDIDFVNCTFDMRNAHAGTEVLNYSGSGKTLTKVTSEIKGGAVILGGNSVTLIKADNLDSNVYTADANGNYVTLKAPAGATISGFEDYYSNGVEGKLVKFDFSKTEDGYDFYVMNVYDDTVSEVTNYGTIPAEYISKADYPFVLFKADNKQFIGGYADLGAALNGMKKTSKTESFVILMRRNAEMNTKTNGDGNLWSYIGETKIDLGGFDLSLTDAGNYLFDLSVQDNSGATLTDGIDVRASYTVVNGSITKRGGHALICMNYGTAFMHSSKFSFYFEGVTFASTTNAKIAGVITNTWENEDKGITSGGDPTLFTDIVFENCVFDYTNSVDGVIMLPMKALTRAGDRVVYNIELKGGKIVSDKAIGAGNIFTANNNDNGRADSFTFVTDTNGEYTTLELTEGISAPIAAFNDNSLMFKEDSKANGIVIYKLGTADVVLEPEYTVYGEIPVEYLDKNAYPIVMFDANAEFVGAYADFGNATADMVAKGATKDYFVLLRANATRNVKTSNHYKLTGNILIDLNGFTLTNTTNGYMLDIFVAGNSGSGVDKRATYTFKNGTINTAKVLFCINYGDLKRDVEFYFNFDNVTFIATHSGNVIFQSWENGYVDANGAIKTLDVDVSETTYATFNNCTFDYASSNSGAIFFDASHTQNGKTGDISVVKVTINGGKIIAKNASSINSFIKFNDNTHGRADSLVFGTNESGEYTKLVLPAGETAPTTAIKNLLGGAMYDLLSTDGRELGFVNVSTSDTVDEYVLAIACKDNDGNHKCDNCGYELSECEDKDNDHYCDVCKEKASECTDSNKDHVCDVCAVVISQCGDTDNNHKCDVCDKTLTECADGNSNHKCDVCDKALTECVDENHDHKCEICGVVSECADKNNDHKCDVCDKTITECLDETNDHKCDVCGATVTECTDEDKNHKCDVCKKVISECADTEIKDHKCDVCDKLISNCADKDKNHVCDICENLLTQCSDKNGDHKCDVCSTVLSECADTDNDHNCDLCGEALSECADTDSDHKCDLCEAVLSECADKNGDHKCDLCETVITSCNDSDKNHNCDICGSVLTECEDANNDHKCDICAATVSECNDADRDHACDVCGDVSECKDDDGDNKCDVCGKVLKVVEPDEPEEEKTFINKVGDWFGNLFAKIAEFFSSVIGKVKDKIKK